MPISIKRISSETAAEARPAKLLGREEATCCISRLEDMRTGIVVSVVEIEVPEETLMRFSLDEDAHVLFVVKGENEAAA